MNILQVKSQRCCLLSVDRILFTASLALSLWARTITLISYLKPTWDPASISPCFPQQQVLPAPLSSSASH